MSTKTGTGWVWQADCRDLDATKLTLFQSCEALTIPLDSAYYRRIPNTGTYTSEASSETGGCKKKWEMKYAKNAKHKTWVILLNAA